MTYLLNTWYCAGWSTDLDGGPIGRKLFDRPIVIYRGTDGRAVALEGRCPHRFAPLAKGRVVGDNLMCPYHGLVFGPTGHCVENPHGDGAIPRGAQVESFVVSERDGTLWIWWGDKTAADENLLPPTSVITKPGYASVTGYLKIEAHYQLVTDNLLDLTHAPYLHPDTVGGRPEDSIDLDMAYDFRMEGTDIIHSDYLVRGMPQPSPQLLPMWGAKPGDFRAEMTWRPATTLELDVFMSPAGAPKTEGLHLPSLHYLTPETETTTHYFFRMGRNRAIEDANQSALQLQILERALVEEDAPMIRDCQELMETDDLFSLKPVILKQDVAAVQARRIMMKLIKQQGRTQVADPEPTQVSQHKS
jgi:phenylpropionate dioxygenase-like ring-hydroxylating dioxygenase large terminal subunit